MVQFRTSELVENQFIMCTVLCTLVQTVQHSTAMVQVRGMYRGQIFKCKECTGTDITSERNVMVMGITGERNVQGTDISHERNVQRMDI